MTPFTEQVIKALSVIPEGKIVTYGLVAAVAGSPKAARQVVRVLHSCSEKYQLPWQRVVSKSGRVVMKDTEAFELQCLLLRAEGVPVSDAGQIPLDSFLLGEDQFSALVAAVSDDFVSNTLAD